MVELSAPTNTQTTQNNHLVSEDDVSIDKDPQQFKVLVKEAVKEWLDEQISHFGWWTLKTLAAFILIGILVITIKYR